MFTRLKLVSMAAAVVAFVAPQAAFAGNTLFQQYVGDYGVSTAGWGSLGSSGTISINVPANSTVVGAWLYSSTYTFGGPIDPSGSTLGGTVLNSWTALGQNPSACCGLQAYRADVTSIVAPTIDGGSGGTYNFGISEINTANQDGEGLVVVYSNAANPTQTIGILNGTSSSTGDTSHINFATPLDPTAPGFFAHMAIGDGFSLLRPRVDHSHQWQPDDHRGRKQRQLRGRRTAGQRLPDYRRQHQRPDIPEELRDFRRPTTTPIMRPTTWRRSSWWETPR